MYEHLRYVKDYLGIANTVYSSIGCLKTEFTWVENRLQTVEQVNWGVLGMWAYYSIQHFLFTPVHCNTAEITGIFSKAVCMSVVTVSKLSG